MDTGGADWQQQQELEEYMWWHDQQTNEEKKMKNTYHVVRVGYNRFCFKTAQEAMAFYQMVSQSTPVTSNYGELPDGRTNISYVLDQDIELGMEQVDAASCELNKTKSQLSEEAKARADIDGGVRVVNEPAAIENHAPLSLEYEEIPF